jgi:uncharacterized glyoxalase superfamily protein PhnB
VNCDEDGGGIYHSIYDDFYWYTHFADMDFRYGRALAETIGTVVMRLADADLLPYDFFIALEQEKSQELFRAQSPDGVIHHAKIQVGDSILEMGEAHGSYQPMPSTFYMYVPNVDAAYKQALQAGARSLSEPVDQSYGDRQAGVQDPFGNTWYISTHISDAM